MKIDDDPFVPKEGYGQEIASQMFRKVIRLDEHRVLKTGGHIKRREADAMKFIAENTTIPVPKVDETRFREIGEASDIVMEYMPGETLESVWTTLSHDKRVATCKQLGGFLTQLKNLKGTRIEGVNGAPVVFGVRFPREGGPFDTEKEFNTFLLSIAYDRMSDVYRYYASAGLMDNHKIHFAHADFAPRNILVDKEGHVTAVLDWEDSGFYPEYWELNGLLLQGRTRQLPNYSDYFHYIHPYEYLHKHLAMQKVHRANGDV